jgi:hypothetical protein
VSTPIAQFAAKLNPILMATGLIAVALLLALTAPPAMAGGGGIGVGGGSGGAGGKSSSAGGAKYDRLWDRVSVKDKRWASRTAECESGKDPDAIGGGGAYRGAFQFLRSTWRSDRLQLQDPGRRSGCAQARAGLQSLARLRLSSFAGPAGPAPTDPC